MTQPGFPFAVRDLLMRFDQRVAGRHRMCEHVLSRVADGFVRGADADGDGS